MNTVMFSLTWVCLVVVVFLVSFIFFWRRNRNLPDTAEGWRKRLKDRGYTQHWFECLWFGRQGHSTTLVACEFPGGVLISLTGWRTPPDTMYVSGWYIDHSRTRPTLLPTANRSVQRVRVEL